MNRKHANIKLQSGFSRTKAIIIAFAWLFIGTLCAAPATLVVDSELKSQPGFQAKSLKSLKAGESVNINKRERGWYQVETDSQQTGWVTLLQVKLAPVEQTNSNNGQSRVVSLRSGHSQITATTGVRGIGEADIANAKADFEAVESAKKYKVSTKNAKKFAASIPLKAQQIKYQEKVDEK